MNMDHITHKKLPDVSLNILILCVCVTQAHIINIPLRKIESAGYNEAKEDNANNIPKDTLHGKPGYGYYMTVELGTPPQPLNILCDTGSSNFAVATSPGFVVENFFNTSRSSTFENRGQDVSVVYTQGNWNGTMGRDVISLPSMPNASVTVNIACINSSSNFFINGSHWQGILGLAYDEIARPDSNTETFFKSLVQQTSINDTFALQMCGTVDPGNGSEISVGGSLSLGGIDSSMYVGQMLWTPIHKEWYYEVIITDVLVNDRSLNMDCKEYNFDKTIVDSGTTNLRFPDKVFQSVVQRLKANTHLDKQDIPEMFWDGLNWLCWLHDKTPWTSFPTLTISLAESENTTFDLVISPQQYLRPVHDETTLNPDEVCYKFAISPSTSGTVIGAVIMEGFYVVFDRENKKIGFGKTTCPSQDMGVSPSHVTRSYPYRRDVSTTDCAYVKPVDHQSTFMTVAYVMAGICGACVIPLILMVVQWQWQKCRPRRSDTSDNSGLLNETEGR